mmetsp:Transcript_65637/g.207632  ORF Transcript_65637/g.207632 Transcript_65637/m.207632 type:complete len:192 (-) Transcript_65637:751-1326(-)
MPGLVCYSLGGGSPLRRCCAAPARAEACCTGRRGGGVATAALAGEQRGAGGAVPGTPRAAGGGRCRTERRSVVVRSNSIDFDDYDDGEIPDLDACLDDVQQALCTVNEDECPILEDWEHDANVIFAEVTIDEELEDSQSWDEIAGELEPEVLSSLGEDAATTVDYKGMDTVLAEAEKNGSSENPEEPNLLL